MHNDLLKCDNQIVSFPNLPITAGVTTNLMGDFKSTNPGSEERIKNLQNITYANCHGRLIPNHGTDIVKFIPQHTDESFHGDACIYGNDQIGYLCLVHCSWITLKKGIIYLSLKKINQLGCYPQKAFIYPGICQICYEVDSLLRDKFNLIHNYGACFKSLRKDHWLLDLYNLISGILTEHGISSGINTIASCSAHSTMEVTAIKVKQPAFFSHRARQDERRNAIFAKLPGDDKLIISTTGDCPYVIFYCLPK